LLLAKKRVLGPEQDGEILLHCYLGVAASIEGMASGGLHMRVHQEHFNPDYRKLQRSKGIWPKIYDCLDDSEYECRAVSVTIGAWGTYDVANINHVKLTLGFSECIYMSWLGLYCEKLKRAKYMKFWTNLCPWSADFQYQGTNNQVPLKVGIRLVGKPLKRLGVDRVARKKAQLRTQRALIAADAFKFVVQTYYDALYQVMVRGPTVALKPRAEKGRKSRLGKSKEEVAVSYNDLIS
jgi:hypothetical protein